MVNRGDCRFAILSPPFSPSSVPARDLGEGFEGNKRLRLRDCSARAIPLPYERRSSGRAARSDPRRKAALPCAISGPSPTPSPPPGSCCSPPRFLSFCAALGAEFSASLETAWTRPTSTYPVVPLRFGVRPFDEFAEIARGNGFWSMPRVRIYSDPEPLNTERPCRGLRSPRYCQNFESTLDTQACVERCAGLSRAQPREARIRGLIMQSAQCSPAGFRVQAWVLPLLPIRIVGSWDRHSDQTRIVVGSGSALSGLLVLLVVLIPCVSAFSELFMQSPNDRLLPYPLPATGGRAFLTVVVAAFVIVGLALIAARRFIRLEPIDALIQEILDATKQTADDSQP